MYVGGHSVVTSNTYLGDYVHFNGLKINGGGKVTIGDYPIFAKFKGGKAVACTFGILFITNIYVYLITLAIYAILLKITKYVSFGSITVFFISGCITFFEIFRTSPFLQIKFDIFYPILILFLAVFIVIKHRSNITRLQKGTENKIKWMG